MARRCRETVSLAMAPISFREAAAFIARHHRHSLPPQGHKFSLAVTDGRKVVGVAVVGRPVSRNADDGLTAEVTRLCTDGTPNAASMLYGAARRIAKEMGFERIITYTLASEPGTSLRAAGWVCVGEVEARVWDRLSRRRKGGISEPKKRWECVLAPPA